MQNELPRLTIALPAVFAERFAESISDLPEVLCPWMISMALVLSLVKRNHLLGRNHMGKYGQHAHRHMFRRICNGLKLVLWGTTGSRLMVDVTTLFNDVGENFQGIGKRHHQWLTLFFLSKTKCAKQVPFGVNRGRRAGD